MVTFSFPFIKGFASTCISRGLTEKEASILLHKAQDDDLFENDPHFRRGFDSVIKQASGITDTLDTLTSAPVMLGIGALPGVLGFADRAINPEAEDMMRERGVMNRGMRGALSRYTGAAGILAALAGAGLLREHFKSQA